LILPKFNAFLKEALPLIDAKTAAKFLARAERHIKAKRFELAQADLTEAIKLDPKLIDAQIRRGFVMLERNDAKSAIADLDAALKIDPKSTRAMIERGIANRVLGRPTRR